MAVGISVSVIAYRLFIKNFFTFERLQIGLFFIKL